jgi:hypothetical protein
VAAVQQFADWLKKLCLSEYAQRFTDKPLKVRIGVATGLGLL